MDAREKLRCDLVSPTEEGIASGSATSELCADNKLLTVAADDSTKADAVGSTTTQNLEVSAQAASDLPPQIGPRVRFRRLRALALVLMLPVIITAYIGLKSRSEQETEFRRLLDQAQLFDLAENFPTTENPYWPRAVTKAQELGENKRLIADLEYKAFSTNCTGSPMKARESLQHAIALYEQTPNAKSPLMKALGDIAVSYCPALIESQMGTSADELRPADQKLNENSPAEAIKIYRRYSHCYRDTSLSFHSRLRKLIGFLKAGKVTLAQVLPLFHQCIYYNNQDVVASLHEYECLNEAIRAAGKDPDDFTTRLKLAQQATNDKDDQGACVEFDWCLARHPADVELTYDLKSAHARVLLQTRNYPTPMEGMSQDDIRAALKSLQELQKLQIAEFGIDSNLTKNTEYEIARAYSFLGEDNEAIKMLQARKKRNLQLAGQMRDQSKSSVASIDDSFIREQIIETDVRAGRFSDALKEFERAAREGTVDQEFANRAQVCIDAGWLDRARNYIAQNKKTFVAGPISSTLNSYEW